jgi:hypothetical protein
MERVLASVCKILLDALAELSIQGIKLNEILSPLDHPAIVLGATHFRESDVNTLLHGSIILNVENSESPWMTNGYLNILRRYHVWDYDRNNAKALESIVGHPVHYLRLFYSPSLTRDLHKEEKDIDVLFFGSFNERRRRVLDALCGRGLRVTAVFDVWGRRLDELIARARVVINIHFYDNGRLEMIRLHDLLANKISVVTELNPGELIDDDMLGAVIAVPYSELVEATEAAVRDPVRCREVAEQGFAALRARRGAAILHEALRAAAIPLGSG